MTWQGVCDGWVTELTTNVAGLSLPLERIHRYAPWSLEQLYAEGTDRHLAIWPQVEGETAGTLVATPSTQMEQSYVVVVWEGVPNADRLMDDNDANAAWLRLHEAARARFQRQANLTGPTAIGQDGTIFAERYVGGAFPPHSHLRVMELRFAVTLHQLHT